MIRKARKDSFVFKKAMIKYKNGRLEYVIVKLLLKAGTKYNDSSTNDQKKCRAKSLKVIDFIDCDTLKPIVLNEGDSVVSWYSNNFVYKKGRIVKVDNFDESNMTCSQGIHFFRRRCDAVNYYFS
jgi:hypothetical protein